MEVKRIVKQKGTEPAKPNIFEVNLGYPLLWSITVFVKLTPSEDGEKELHREEMT
jgi:hypothetical protein